MTVLSVTSLNSTYENFWYVLDLKFEWNFHKECSENILVIFSPQIDQILFLPCQ